MKCPYCDGSGTIEAPTLGVLVTIRRKMLNMTQLELSVASGLSRGQIANLEGDRTDLSMKALFRVAHALGCRPSELLP